MMRKVNQREAMRMMQRMGMQIDEVPNVAQVIIQTDNKEITIREPSVSSVMMQGQRMYQVAGGTVSEKPLSREYQADAADVKIVSEQAGVSEEQARQALVQTSGDLAQAILRLKK